MASEICSHDSRPGPPLLSLFDQIGKRLIHQSLKLAAFRSAIARMVDRMSELTLVTNFSRVLDITHFSFTDLQLSWRIIDTS